MYCRNFTMSSFFDVKKQRPTMNLEKCYQCSVTIEISPDLKVYFSLVTCKINNLIALRSTNQIIEISAPWWLSLKLQFSLFFMYENYCLYEKSLEAYHRISFTGNSTDSWLFYLTWTVNITQIVLIILSL